MFVTIDHLYPSTILTIILIKGSTWAGNPYRRGRLSTVDLLILTSLYQLLLTTQVSLIRRSSVLSLPLESVFPDLGKGPWLYLQNVRLGWNWRNDDGVLIVVLMMMSMLSFSILSAIMLSVATQCLVMLDVVALQVFLCGIKTN